MMSFCFPECLEMANAYIKHQFNSLLKVGAPLFPIWKSNVGTSEEYPRRTAFWVPALRTLQGPLFSPTAPPIRKGLTGQETSPLFSLPQGFSPTRPACSAFPPPSLPCSSLACPASASPSLAGAIPKFLSPDLYTPFSFTWNWEGSEHGRIFIV